MKKVLSTAFILVFILSLAVGCSPGPQPESTSASTEAPTTSAPDGGILPLTKKIPVVREGEEELLSARLVASGSYSIYVFDDIEFTAAEDGDMFIPKGQNENPHYYMRVTVSDGSAGLPADRDTDGFVTKYSRITKENGAYDIEMYYSYEAEEGGLVLLKAMLDTFAAG
ncbi:MAG: hypothetical protein FWF08_01710 [Oscillospiraceae bacterium]|nr:hypothetical protein [Oscillospiraceae bacterium]